MHWISKNRSRTQNWQRLVVPFILLAASFGLTAAQPAEAGLSPAPYLSPEGYLQVPEGFEGGFDLDGWNVEMDATRGLRLAPAPAIPGAWSSLNGPGSGLSSGVSVIEIAGGVIYAGGNFSNAGGDPDADFIAMFSGGAWSSLGGAGTGLNGNVGTIEITGGVIYAGGNFTNAGGDVDADAIAIFSGGAWSSLGGAGTGLGGSVRDIEIAGGVIYAGGAFTNAGGDADADRIAMFSGGAWSSLGGAGTGLNLSVNDIEIVGGVLYAGGAFTNAGGDADADRIAMFSGGAWSSLGGPGSGLNNVVYEIEIVAGVIYAGGFFTIAGGDPDADRIAMFSGGAWSSLGGAGTGLSSVVYDIEVVGSVIYASGSFANAGTDPDADNIAIFSGGAWSSLGGAGTGLPSVVQDIKTVGGTLYASGSFDNAGGDPDADNIAQYGLPVAATTTPAVEECNSRNTGVSGGVFNLKCAWVDIPAAAIPAGADANANACRLTVKEAGTAADYGYSINETVWDIRLVCDGQQVRQLAAPITICVKPTDGSNANKALFHRHGDAGAFNALPDALGRAGWVCGSTSRLSLFLAGQFLLPNTGFASNTQTELGIHPESLTYTNTSMTLNIPQLGLSESIVGVAHSPAGWDVSWLGDDAGYLAGTAFPTWAGNTALTGHVWNADGRPGIFHGLDQLQHGDQFTIEAWGQTFIYEVRDTELVSPRNLSVLEHSEYDMITLITCESFSEFTEDYRHRRVVTAVLVDVR